MEEYKDKTSTIIKEVIEGFSVEKTFFLLFLAEKGLIGEYNKYVQVKVKLISQHSVEEK